MGVKSSWQEDFFLALGVCVVATQEIEMSMFRRIVVAPVRLPSIAVILLAALSAVLYGSVAVAASSITFFPGAAYPTGTNPISVATADLNGDGHPDLVVANGGDNTVSVLINNGNGTFAPKVDYTTGTAPQSVAVADVNSDGHPDLVVANGGDNTVSVLLNNGNGTFAPKVDYATGNHPFSVAAANLNGDSHPDIIPY